MQSFQPDPQRREDETESRRRARAAAEARAGSADAREEVADERDRLADVRDVRTSPASGAAPAPDRSDDEGRDPAPAPSRTAEEAGSVVDDWTAEKREVVADHRQLVADERDSVADEREADDVQARATPLTPGERTRLEDARDARQRAGAARRRVDEARARADMPRPLAHELIAVTEALSQHTDLETSFQHVVDIAKQIAENCDAVSYTARLDDSHSTLASTDPLAVTFDRAQYRSGEGPCLDASDLGAPVTSADVRVDERWPTFTAALAHAVSCSVMSTPISAAVLEDPRLGSLNHYGPAGSGFDDDDLESAMLLSVHLGALLALRAAHGREEEHLRAALVSRDIIGQAKGLLMARQGIDADEAFDVLRRASQRLNRRLREVAADLATGAIDHTSPEDRLR